MHLRPLPRSLPLSGKRVLLRVDWNVELPVSHLSEDDAIKIKQSLATINALRKRGAVVVLLTHLGRPHGHALAFSTAPLAEYVRRAHKLNIVFHPEAVGNAKECERLRKALLASGKGTVHLLENVRFEPGEESEDRRLSRQYATLGDYFVNDAFASCHRAHATVSGLAKIMLSFAGPNLVRENDHLVQLLSRPKKPFVAIVGGLKIANKLPVIKKLLTLCDAVCIGGAMATTVEAAKGAMVGQSVVERAVLVEAKRLAKNKKILLPVDAMVRRHGRYRYVSMSQLERGDVVVDIGPKTVDAWAATLRSAKTILWNGTVGKVELRPCRRGTAALIQRLARGRASVYVGGGSIVPLVYQERAEKKFKHVSMGGGALLEFVEKNGKLPGLLPLKK
ncbi:MAG: phosphoglycerate kinase [bacterium]|nr:phosphoglycerate kinase [bacterium]